MTGSRRAFERKIEALRALPATADAAGAHARLAAGLRDRDNYVVATAAQAAADLRAEALVPDLLAAFDRFFVDPVASDPRCLGKSAIARALRSLGHRDPEPFLRGIRHVQREPAWEGRADAAGVLRGICALALPDTRLGDLEVLTHLADALADQDRQVRVDAVAALEALNRPEGALLLRLRALIGDPDPDVLERCLSAYLSLAPDGAVSFVGRFLHAPSEDAQLAAISALAQCRDARAIAALADFWQASAATAAAGRALLIGLGASPLREAAEFLLGVVAGGTLDLAATALAALATSRFAAEFRPRVAGEVEQRDSSALAALFARAFVPGASAPGD